MRNIIEYKAKKFHFALLKVSFIQNFAFLANEMLPNGKGFLFENKWFLLLLTFYKRNTKMNKVHGKLIVVYLSLIVCAYRLHPID